MLMWLNQLIQDLRFGLRTFVRTPGFTTLAVLSLALGIMATTAMYSVIHAVILDPFPYKDVDALMSVKVSGPDREGYRTYYNTDEYLEIAERSTIFDGVISSTISDILWTGEGDPQRLRGNFGTPNTFLVMGVPALIGRSYLPDDGRADAAPVAVLGYRFWQRQFGGDPTVVGRQLRLNDKVRTIVGVMPKRFMWRGADVYLPITFERGRAVEGVRDVHVLGRLKPNVTEAQAEMDLKPIIQDLVQRCAGAVSRSLARRPAVLQGDVPEQHSRRPVAALWRGGAAALDCLRERVEPAAVEGGRTPARDGRTVCARGQPLAPRAPIVDRERAPGRRRRHRRHGARLWCAADNPDARTAEYHP